MVLPNHPGERNGGVYVAHVRRPMQHKAGGMGEGL